MDDVGLPHGARLASDFATAFEQDQRRNAADAELACELGLGVGIELRESCPRLQLGSSGRVLRRHALTRAAPRRPEIHHHWHVAVLDVSTEITARDLDGVAREQRLMAAPALRYLPEPDRGDAVDGVAARANDVQCLGHGPSAGVATPLFQDGGGEMMASSGLQRGAGSPQSTARGSLQDRGDDDTLLQSQGHRRALGDIRQTRTLCLVELPLETQLAGNRVWLDL